MPKVYITNTIPHVGVKMLKAHGFDVDMNSSNKPISKPELKDVLSTYYAVLSYIPDKIDEEIIKSAGQGLKIISNFAVGFDNIDVLSAKRHGIVVCNTPGVANQAVAEHVFALILSVAKNILNADRFVRMGKFKNWDGNLFVSPELWGKSIGIVGMGRIGTFVASIAYGGFRMKVLYHDIVRSEDLEMLTEAKFCTLEHLLKESDVVSLHVPLLPTTRHLISKEEFRLMKETAILVNTARGPIVDEKALIEALKEGQIAGAGLDVFEHEPHIPHELTTLGNAILTPHIGSATLECREEMATIAAQNIIDVFDGKTPFGLVKVS